MRCYQRNRPRVPENRRRNRFALAVPGHSVDEPEEQASGALQTDPPADTDIPVDLSISNADPCNVSEQSAVEGLVMLGEEAASAGEITPDSAAFNHHSNGGFDGGRQYGWC